MSREGGGATKAAMLVAAVAVGLLIFQVAGDGPAGSQPAAACGAAEPHVCFDEDGDGDLDPFCPAVVSCSEPVPQTTMVDTLPTVTAPPTAPPPTDTQATTTAAPADTAPPTDAPTTVTPATVPPGPQPPRDDTGSQPQSAPPPSNGECATGNLGSVRAGEGWYALSDRYDVLVDDLLTLNYAGLDTPLVVGQPVCLPEGASSSSPAPTSPPATRPPTTPPAPPIAPKPTTAPSTTAVQPRPTNAPTTTQAPPTSKAPKVPITSPPTTTTPPKAPKPTYPRPPATTTTTTTLPGCTVC